MISMLKNKLSLWIFSAPKTEECIYVVKLDVDKLSCCMDFERMRISGSNHKQMSVMIRKHIVVNPLDAVPERIYTNSKRYVHALLARIHQAR